MDNPVRAAGYIHCIFDRSGYFLRRRQKYQNFLENGVFNFVLVFCYNLLCYLLTGLPSAPGGIPVPGFFGNPASRVIFLIIGWVLIGVSILLMGTAIRQRKTLGGQNVKEGLLTGGLYRIFRHPIYTGVILGLPGSGFGDSQLGWIADAAIGFFIEYGTGSH